MRPRIQSSPSPIPVLSGKKEWAFFIFFSFLIFSYNLFGIYQDYQGYSKSEPQALQATIKLQYRKQKGEKSYFVLKLEDRNAHIFYTTSRQDLKDLIYRDVRVFGKMAECSFWEFLKSCYFHTYQLSLLPKESYKKPLRDFIDKQHGDANSALLYKALFFGDRVNPAWRNIANVTGTSHLIAISGFHLGLLSSILFFLLFLPYRFLQKRFFPYRNLYYDLGCLVLLGMFGYLVLLEFQPAFFRAFLMAALAYLFYLGGVALFSFSMLFVVVLLSLAFFPSFAWNVGFVLSVFGVFYIFLFVRHVPKKRILLYFFGFNLCMFLLMGIVVHFYFPYFSPYQFLAIPISMIFPLYFPLVIALHLLGLGDALDPFYLWVLGAKIPFIEFYTPWPLFLGYVLASFGAIFSRKIFFVLLLFGIGFYGFLLLRFCKILGIGV
ncbi:DNA transfer protein ComE [Helicobacter mustelae]|uniref:ComEC/Rec2 family competence protein n=1 Tax=Helicobacter mustelae TaxID=217 RepID=UPI000E075466|nr:ComEC/Rec2 family competence protein [Helicobacter mustelae]STP13126.1 DNA transfer protein ComE [Helicobacter mustelae]